MQRSHLAGTVFFAALAFAGLNLATLVQAAPPEWIWSGKQSLADEVAQFRTTFEVKGEIKSAKIAAACDNHLKLFVNGEKLAEHGAWESAVAVDVAKHLKPGANTLAVEARNEGESPAGLILHLEVKFAQGDPLVVDTNANWKFARNAPAGWQKPEFDDKEWKAAVSVGKLGDAPWGNVALNGAGPARAAATPGQATAADQLTLPAGFKAELLYSVPRELHGSWVNLCVDGKGRLIASNQNGILYRITVDQPQPGQVDVQPIEVYVKENGKNKGQPLGKAHGLCWAFDSLYVVITDGGGAGNGLYRVRDTNGDDQLDTAEFLRQIEGGGEHGPHAVKLGPDGNLWVIAGNHTKVPQPVTPDSPHRNFQEDHLLKRNPDGNGHATGIMAPGGWVCRIDLEGKTWRLFCAGFRNEFDFDWNADGEMFTYDSDMEWDTGVPWYRPTRVNHCVSAAEFGWRYGTGKWPEYYADSLGAVANIGLGSPTGVVFGTGAKFPAKYQRALFINDWTYGKIYAVHLTPAGASYTSEFEVFVQAKPLPVTDVVIHPDGAMYFTIGGRGTQSGLYRVTYTGSEPTSPVGPLVDAKATAARALRKQLEAFHDKSDPKAVEFAWPHLNSADRNIRYAARVAIERQDLAQWQAKALAEKRPTALIYACVALARSGQANDKSLQNEIVSRLSQLSFAQLTEEQKLDLCRAYGLTFIRQGTPEAKAAQETLAQVSPQFPGPNELVNREVFQLLVYLKAPNTAERGLAQLKTAQTQQDQMYYVFVLRNLAEGWTADQRKAFFSWIALAETKYKGGASFKNFLKQIRKDATDLMPAAEVAALQDVIEGKNTVPVVALETTRQFLHNWQMEDVLPLLDQVEQGRNFESGKNVFQAAQCAKCHRFQNEGGATGPDLTGVGNRFNAQYLAEALIVPSKIISDQYQQSVITTTDGEVFVGRIIDQSGDVVQVRSDPFALQLRGIPKAKIESQQPSPTSEMPQGLLNVLTKEEILDLIAYMRSAGDPNDKAFKK